MRRILTISILLCCTTAFPQAWSGLINTNRAIDWTGAGATIPGTLPPNCATQPSAHTVAALNTAIVADEGGASYCTIDISSWGATSVTGTILVQYAGKANIVINGGGPNVTKLTWTATPSNPCIGFNATNVCLYNGDSSINSHTLSWANNATISSGYAQGSTSMVLSTHTNLQVGSLIQIAQNDLATDPGNGPWFCQSDGANGDCTQQGTDTSPSTPSPASETQMVTVTGCGATTFHTACTSNTVTFTPAIYAPNFTSGQTPKGWWQSTFPLYNVGIQNISINVAGITAGTIWETLAANNVWFTNDTSINGTGAGSAATNHYQMYQSTNVTVAFNYMYGANPQYNGYGLDCGGGTSNSLFLSNITQHMPTGQITETCDGSVFAYNYSVDNYYGSNWQQSDQLTHDAGSYYVLWEGNIGIMSSGDDIHGTSAWITRYRNYISGFDPTTNDGGVNSNVIALEHMAYDRYDNDVANVLGTAGENTKYQYAMASATDCGPGDTGYVYVLGNSDQNVTTWTASGAGGCYPGGFTINSDLLVATSLMRWGNWDDVTNAVRECKAGSASPCTADETGSGAPTYPGLASPSTTFPQSFIFSSQPSWWVFPSGTASPWPGIGPDVTGGDISGTGGHANLNPAANCYLKVMGGLTNGTSGPLTYNPSACYPASSNPTPAAATNLFATPL